MITNFLKKLFQRESQPAGAVASIAPAANVQNIRRDRESQGPLRPNPYQSGTAKAAPAAISAPAGGVSLTLKAIVDLLPTELRATVRKQPSEHVRITIPRETIESQLATGAVRMPFGQLRAATPPQFFVGDEAANQIPVLLPIHEILAQIKPVRRRDQTRTDVPDGVSSIFARAVPAGVPASNGGNLRASAGLRQAPPAVDAHPGFTRRPGKFVPPPNVEAPPSADIVQIPLASILSSLPGPVRSGLAGTDCSRVGVRLPVSELEPLMNKGKFVVEWRQLRNWLDRVVPIPLEFNASVELPLPVIVPLLLAAKKLGVRGKPVEIESALPDLFVKPQSAPIPEPAAAEPLLQEPELPELETPEPEPEPEPPKLELAPEPEPVAPQTLRILSTWPSAVDAGSAAKPADEPENPPMAPKLSTPVAAGGRGRWAPQEIVSEACELDGVEGAFIGTHDGLLVTGRTPQLDERLLCAFMPNLFSKFEAYTLLSKLGQPQSILVTLPERVLKVFRCGKLYLGVIGGAGESLSVARLAEIAVKLQAKET